ncbi:MAG: hypothetical protein ACJ763_16275 [Bdellovibrionia bacterium]
MAKSKIWKWLYALSLPIAALIFFLPNSRWGAMDEGEFLYKDGAGAMSWLEHLSLLFLPQKERIFLFGTFRPLPYRFYFKLLTSMGVSAHSYNYFDWVGSWLACLAFAWGILVLVRKAIPLGKETLWLIALLVWWTPTWVLCTTMIYPDCWMQPGLLGLFWAFFYADDKDLPAWSRAHWVRYPLAIFSCFLACQSHEATFFMLFWTSFWNWVVSDKKQIHWGEVLTPAILGTTYVLLYRGLNPGTSNRPEIVISYAPINMAHTARYYLLIGLYAISKPFLDLLNLKAIVLGQSEAEYPIAFVLATAGTLLALNPLTDPLPGKANPRIKLTWLLLLGGLICTVPYFVMQNRSLVYYGLRLQIFLAAFVAIRAAWSKEAENQKLYSLAMILYLGGAFSATYTLMDGWNWAKHYGGVSLAVYDKVIHMPGTEECTQARPCCLEFTQWQWVYNETTVNWNDGAPYPPRFVKPGATCFKTYRYDGPYDWGWH